MTNDIISNSIVQLGAVGTMIAGLAWFSRRLFADIMMQLKELREENKQLEVSFRDYLIRNAKEHHEIIRKNTEAYNKFIAIADKIIRYEQKKIEI